MNNWDLTPLFKSDSDPNIEKDINQTKQAVAKFVKTWQKNKQYLESDEVLLQSLEDFEYLQKNFSTSGKAGYYFSLRTQTDQDNTTLKAKYNSLEEIESKLQNELLFYTLSLSKIEPKLQDKFLNSPKLLKYQHFLERLFAEGKYLLSEAEEKILNLKSLSSYTNWVEMTSRFLSREEDLILDEDGKKSRKNFSEIINLMNSKNKKTRDFAAGSFNKILSKHSLTAESEINSILYDKKINDTLRGAKRADSLRHLSDDIETKIVDQLVTQVSKEFAIAQKYYQLKAKLFKVKKLQYHERNLEYGSLDKNFQFLEACKIVSETLNQISPAFNQIFKQFLKQNQIDVYPKKGKRSGAFCTHRLITQPTYILLNYTNRLQDVLTLAHEVGHGINNELVRISRHALDFDTPLSTAEVASTFFEDFVLEEILKGVSDEEKLTILMMKLNEDINTIFRQIAFYQFETKLHQEFRVKSYLDKEVIGELFQKEMENYMGPSVEQSKGSANWWIYVPHFRSFFYVYSYALGQIISKSLQTAVKKDPMFISKIIEFLSTGLSKSPSGIFSDLGIKLDEEFWNQGLNEVELLLEEASRLAKKLHKI